MGADALKNLALSDTGFVFDPTTGNTYTLNETSLAIIRLLKQEKTKEEIIQSILAEYEEVDAEEIERDLSDMMIQLNELGLYK
jgi:PqqD family protein of HPr-rel-A system